MVSPLGSATHHVTGSNQLLHSINCCVGKREHEVRARPCANPGQAPVTAKPQFPHLENGDSSFFIRLLGRVTELMHALHRVSSPKIFAIVSITWGLPRWLSGKRTCLPVQEKQVRFLGQEEPLKKEMATNSSILVWEIPWAERNLAGFSPAWQASGITEELDVA